MASYCDHIDERAKYFIIYLLHYNRDLNLHKITFQHSDVIYGVISDNILTQTTDENNSYAIELTLTKRTVLIEDLVKEIESSRGIVVNISDRVTWDNDFTSFIDLSYVTY